MDVVEQLKAFERKEKHHKARAATNLAFLYLLEGDVEQATRYASLAVKHDRYNAKALVNMGELAAPCRAQQREPAAEVRVGGLCEPAVPATRQCCSGAEPRWQASCRIPLPPCSLASHLRCARL